MSAAYSRVLVGPDPPESGTTLQVLQDDGDKFPTPPFVALLWPTQFVPLSGNSEEVTVTEIVGDTLTIERGESTIPLEAGMQIAALRTIPYFRLRDAVTLQHDFGDDDPPYTLLVRAPTGETGAYGSATGVVDDGQGVASFNFESDRSGTWYYRFKSHSQQGPDQSFYVAFSDTLS